MTQSFRPVVGFDSCRFVRGNFQALMGVGVTVNDHERFRKAYDRWLDNIFDEVGLKRDKLIYKSFDLNKLFGDRIFEIYDQFVEETKDHIHFLDLFYSYFYPSDGHRSTDKTDFLDEKDERNEPIPKFIKVYYKEPGGIETVSGIEFLDLIDHSYPLICAWDYFSRNPNTAFTARIDHFDAKPSNIWCEVLKNKHKFKLEIVYGGDKCDDIISSADILLNYLHEEIKKNNIPLNRKTHDILHKNFNRKFETRFLGSKYLWEMTPSNKWVVNNHAFIKHPIYFVFLEGAEDFKKIYPQMDERKLIEDSPFIDMLYVKAATDSGSVKYYNPNTDNRLIQKEDKFFYYDVNGRRKIDYLAKLGYKNEIISSEELMKNKDTA